MTSFVVCLYGKCPTELDKFRKYW